jgi:hypothetical protein
MTSIAINDTRNEVAIQPKNAATIPDAHLMKLCARADKALATGNASSGDDGEYYFDKARTLMFDKIMPIAPISPEGRRAKAATMISIGYEWGTDMSNAVVAKILQDLVAPQPIFA